MCNELFYTANGLLSLHVHDFSIKALQDVFFTTSLLSAADYCFVGHFSSHVVFSQIVLQWADKALITRSLQQWQNFDPVRRRPPSLVDTSQLLLPLLLLLLIVQQNQSEKSLCLFGVGNLRRG